MIFNRFKVLKSCSLSTQSLASCVNYFVWNCLPCFSNTKIGSVTSFSILFNFQGPVSASADRLTTWLFYHRSDFLSSSFFRSFWTFWTWMSWSFSEQTGLSWRLLVLFKGFLLRLRKSFFCLSAWRSSIIPHPRLLVNTFWQIFSILFCTRPETASDREVYAPQLLWCSLAQMPFLFAYIMYYKAFAV